MRFTLYAPTHGDSDVLTRYVERIANETERKRCLALLWRFADQGPTHDETRFRALQDGMFEIKPQPHRFLYFYAPTERGIVVVGALFRKRSQKTPRRELDRVRRTREEWTRSRR